MICILSSFGADRAQFISKQDYSGKIEVILIDNGSTDDTVKAAKQEAERLGLSIITFEETMAGKHHALNKGLNHVATNLVITLDADTLILKSSVRYLVSRMQSAPPDVCAVAGSMLVRNSRTSFWTRLQEWDYFIGIASIKTRP
jgi:poly-beta-1,6-N-acetyl-D-glucosamine synthase